LILSTSQSRGFEHQQAARDGANSDPLGDPTLELIDSGKGDLPCRLAGQSRADHDDATVLRDAIPADIAGALESGQDRGEA
jgi:hypothetical protein